MCQPSQDALPRCRRRSPLTHVCHAHHLDVGEDGQGVGGDEGQAEDDLADVHSQHVVLGGQVLGPALEGEPALLAILLVGHVALEKKESTTQRGRDSAHQHTYGHTRLTHSHHRRQRRSHLEVCAVVVHDGLPAHHHQGTTSLRSSESPGRTRAKVIIQSLPARPLPIF